VTATKYILVLVYHFEKISMKSFFVSVFFLDFGIVRKSELRGTLCKRSTTKTVVLNVKKLQNGWPSSGHFSCQTHVRKCSTNAPTNFKKEISKDIQQIKPLRVYVSKIYKSK